MNHHHSRDERGGGANHLMTQCPRQAESTKLPLSGRGRAVTVRGQLRKQATLRRRPHVLGDTGDAALSTFLSHASSSKGCVRVMEVLFLKSVDTLFMESSASTNPWTSLHLETHRRHRLAEREREESIAFQTYTKENVIGPCR